MKMVELGWSSANEEGTVRFLKSFDDAYLVMKVDALNDWISELTSVRNSLYLSQDSAVRESLWGTIDT